MLYGGTMAARMIGRAATLVLLACGSGQETPGPGTDEASSSTGVGSTSTSTGADDEPTTSEATTGGETSTTAGTTGGSSTTAGTTEDGLPICGPPCAETWESGLNLLTVGPDDDLAKFACLTRVQGSLEIQGLSTGDLQVFANLRRVDKDFTISGPDVTELGAFACLEQVGKLVLADLPALVDTSGLAGLRIAETIIIEETGLASLPTLSPAYEGIHTFVAAENPALVDLGPLAEWHGLTPLDLQLRDNPLITDISALAGPLNTDRYSFGQATVELVRLPALVSLVGLPPRDATSWKLQDLPLVPDLAPLSGVQYSSGIHLSGMPLVTSLFGLHELGYSYFISIGDCESESSGMAGLKDLSGLDALDNVIVLSIVNNEALESLAGVPMLNEVQVLNVVNNPLIDAADVDAFLAPTDTPPIEACLGPWGECVCAGPPPN